MAKTITRQQLEQHLTQFLQPEKFKDYCPNGLQVEGKEEISVIVSGVTANQALLEEAIRLNADAIVVHHGYFWKGEQESIKGIKRQRLKTLLQHDINLFAYHLPLDAHDKVGNNILMARSMGWKVDSSLSVEQPNIGLVGSCKPCDVRTFTEQLTQQFQPPIHIAGAPTSIRKIAWCTGAAQSFFEHAIDAGVDAYITGEISEPTVHMARETGVHFFACGHHATERFGAEMLGEYIAKKYGVTHHFINIPSPV